MKILYIEDDIVDQKMFKRLLRRLRHFRVDIVSCMGEALIKSNTATYDLIISDFYIGADTAKDILATIHHAPIAVLSGLNDQNFANELYQLGAVAVLQKPLNILKLQTLVRRLPELTPQ